MSRFASEMMSSGLGGAGGATLENDGSGVSDSRGSVGCEGRWFAESSEDSPLSLLLTTAVATIAPTTAVASTAPPT